MCLRKFNGPASGGFWLVYKSTSESGIPLLFLSTQKENVRFPVYGSQTNRNSNELIVLVLAHGIINTRKKKLVLLIRREKKVKKLI